jgi:hypothetical protein
MAEPVKTDITKNPEWWAEWFDADYSWEGLAKLEDNGTPVHPWEGWVVVDEARCVPKDEATSDDTKRTRPATLQDYWRADPQDNWRLRDVATLNRERKGEPIAELVGGDDTPDGRTWHIAHLPAADAETRETTWKSLLDDPRWGVVQRLLQTRINAARETRFMHGEFIEGPDLCAQLSGCVLCQTLPTAEGEGSIFHIRANQSAHLGNCDYRLAQWGPRANFESAIFAGYANFRDARFSGKADFERASFSSTADFQRARFSGYALFYHANFSGRVAFDHASFSDDAAFYRASFSDSAAFRSASFSGDAGFRGASFSSYTDFISASFSGNTVFESASFSGNADFKSASFSGNADFESASFSGNARFHSASFSGNADFESASFSDDTGFQSASFLRGLNLQRGTAPAQPAGQIYRVGAEGHNPASLTRGEKGRLEAGDFALTLTTGAARREMGAFSGFNFRDALCLGPARFNDRSFGQAPDFSDARFYDRAEFHRADMHEGARFFQAKFRLDGACTPLEWEALTADLCERHRLRPPPSEGKLKHWPDDLEHHDRAFWRAAYAAWQDYWTSACAVPAPEPAPLFSFTALRRLPGRVWAWVNPGARKPRHRHLPDADLHEAAYRRLKLIMRQIGSHIEEQRFFALELKARQKRDDVAVWERWAAAAYGGLADYGRSAVRPLYWLAGVWAAFAVSYTLLASGAGVLPEMAQWPAPEPEHEQGWVVDPPHPLTGVWTHRDALARQSGATLGSAFTRYSGPVVFAFEITVVPVANPVRNHTWSEALNDRDGYSTAFSLLRLLNRMMAVPLLFLFALSLRRRFQIG